MIQTLPNILTVFRLIAAPGIALCFVFLERGFADWAALILFVGAAFTDYLDGYLARRWRQVSKFGTMLDPIADKAMVVIALMIVVALFDMAPVVLAPVTLILFREVFVSGLREYLGSEASQLKVTSLAKWKTAVQMVAVTVLLANGVFVHYLWALSYGMDAEVIDGILNGQIEDVFGLNYLRHGAIWSYRLGLTLLWIAALLTVVTGWDYFMKSRPYLQDET